MENLQVVLNIVKYQIVNQDIFLYSCEMYSILMHFCIDDSLLYILYLLHSVYKTWLFLKLCEGINYSYNTIGFYFEFLARENILAVISK